MTTPILDPTLRNSRLTGMAAQVQVTSVLESLGWECYNAL